MAEIKINDLELSVGRDWDPSYNFEHLIIDDEDETVIDNYDEAINVGMTVSGTVDKDTLGVYEVTYSYESITATAHISVWGIETTENEQLDPIEVTNAEIVPATTIVITDETIDEQLNRIEGKIDTILSILQPDTGE